MANLSRADGAKIVKLLITGMISFLFLVSYVFFQSYQGRFDLVDSQRAACEAAKKDRMKTSNGWQAQGDYKLAAYFERRSHVNCSEVFPKAGLLP